MNCGNAEPHRTATLGRIRSLGRCFTFGKTVPQHEVPPPDDDFLLCDELLDMDVTDIIFAME